MWASPVKGVSLSARPGGGVVANQVEQNFVFASGDDGIFVDNPGAANPNTFRQNTSIRNAGCDLNDVSATPNVWEQNRAGSRGAHTYTAEQYGLTDDEIRDAFAPYLREYGHLCG